MLTPKKINMLTPKKINKLTITEARNFEKLNLDLVIGIYSYLFIPFLFYLMLSFKEYLYKTLIESYKHTYILFFFV